MEHPVLLFDGVCNLCNNTVQFVIRHDPAGTVHFAALQSQIGQQLQQQHQLDPQRLDSLIFVDGGRAYTHSDAALRLARYLQRPWSFARVGLLVPRPIRNLVYRWIARNRYRWFGQTESCMLPTPQLRQRFLDQA